MWDTLFTIVFGLLAALMAVDVFGKWRRSHKALYIVSAAVALAALPVFLFSWISGFGLLLLSAILRFAGARIASRSA